MNLRYFWVNLLCIGFILMLFDNLIAQDRSKSPKRKTLVWEGPPIGSLVKDFELPIFDGGTFKLSNHRGNIVVIELGSCT